MEFVIMRVQDYTPRRIYDVFLDFNDEIQISHKTGIFRLKGIGRTIWYLLDGKHTILQIAEKICIELSLNVEKVPIMINDLLNFIDMLKKRDSVIVNWDPLYKYDISQELNL